MTQAEFIALAAARYQQIQALNKLDSFYDYEKDFDQLWTGLGRDVLEKNLGDLPNDPQPPQSATRKVVISDGAAWIAPWVAQTYPNAVHILDLFHVLEKVAVVAQDALESEQWFEQQKQALLASQLADVLVAIDGIDCRDKVQQAQIRSYLVNHSHQMDYAYYRSQGWMVSSGPIESAHRTVLQVRMKRSGQRWSGNRV